MADKTIGSLPQAQSVDDSSLFVCEQQGVAMKTTGAQWKGFAIQAVSQYVEPAQQAAQQAQQAAQQATQAVSQIGTAVEDTQANAQAAQEAKEAAETAQGLAEVAQAAAESAADGVEADALAAEQAKNAAVTAQGAAEGARDTAQGYATSASESAATATQKAEEAAGSAVDAAQSAASIEGDVEAAQTAATQAAGSASAAAGSASAAADSASDAADSATAASESATAASGSAQAAASSASAALQSETNAETAASNAAQSETNASGFASAASESATAAAGSASTASQAASDAQSAQTLAETAQAGAEDAETGAEAARDAILNMLVEAITLETGKPATVTKSLVDQVYKLTFGLPKGDTGDTGAPGPQGVSVESIQLTSGNHAPGTTDTYTITLSDGSTFRFTVYNGANGTGVGDFMADGSVPMTGALDMGGQKVTNVGAPTDPTDAVRQSDLEAISNEIDHILDGTTPVTVPVATEIKAGIVKPGEGMSVTEDGTLNVDDQLPAGGQTGQVLTKTESGEAWQDAPDGLPEGGETGQVLTKTSTGAQWDDVPSDFPTGGTGGQILTKTTDGVAWENPPDTGVTTFNGRTGAVTPQAGDYTAEMVGARADTWTPSATDVGAVPASDVGAPNGVAELDSTGRVPNSQLPSYVDDVLEYDSLTNFPQTGEDGKIYIAEDTNLQYRWSGTQYVEISPSLALGETSSTAYRGDRGKIAYDHSQTTCNPHGTTAAQVGARPDTWMPSASDVGAVPTSRTVNGKALSSNISLTASDVGARANTWTPTASEVGAVPTSRTVNGKALSSNITLDADDVGALDQTSADARYLQLSGGEVNGEVKIRSNPLTFVELSYSSEPIRDEEVSISQEGITYYDDDGYVIMTNSIKGVAIDGTIMVEPGNGGYSMGCGGGKINNVGAPEYNSDAANKAYVDSIKPTRLTATLPSSGWSGNSQTITVNGVITDTSAQDIDISCADKASADAWAAGGVWCSNPTTANQLTFTCTTAPTANINLNIRLWEVG